jgi:hypothetical protein
MAPQRLPEKYSLHYYKSNLFIDVLAEQCFSMKQISVLEHPQYSSDLALFGFFMTLKLQVELSIQGYLESSKDKGSKMEIPLGYIENYFHKNL